MISDSPGMVLTSSLQTYGLLVADVVLRDAQGPEESVVVVGRGAKFGKQPGAQLRVLQPGQAVQQVIVQLVPTLGAVRIECVCRLGHALQPGRRILRALAGQLRQRLHIGSQSVQQRLPGLGPVGVGIRAVQRLRQFLDAAAGRGQLAKIPGRRQRGQQPAPALGGFPVDAVAVAREQAQRAGRLGAARQSSDSRPSVVAQRGQQIAPQLAVIPA